MASEAPFDDDVDPDTPIDMPDEYIEVSRIVTRLRDLPRVERVQQGNQNCLEVECHREQFDPVPQDLLTFMLGHGWGVGNIYEQDEVGHEDMITVQFIRGDEIKERVDATDISLDGW